MQETTLQIENGNRQEIDPREALTVAAVLAHIKDSRLTSSITFYVPSTNGSEVQIAQKKFQKRTENIARQFADLFGGSTVTYGSGFWINAAGKLISERINLVTSNVEPADLAGHYSRVLDLAEKYRIEWK